MYKSAVIFNIMLIILCCQKVCTAQEQNISAEFSIQQYFLPSEDDLSIPVLSVNYNDWLIESRYNYEARDAASLWLGKVYSFGESLEFELTPLIGAIFNSFEGAAPGLKTDITYKKLNIYSELEYVFDFDSRDNNYFYSWNEITYGISDNLRLGIVGNRTRAYSSSVELDRGPIAYIDFESISFFCSALNLDDSPIIVSGLALSY